MDVKERLVELIGKVQDEGVDYAECFGDGDRPAYVKNDVLADHLIANGVTVADGKDTDVPDNNVGNKWIPVAERLPYAELNDHVNKYPEDHFEVLVMIKGAKIPTTLCFEDGEFYFPYGEYGGAIYPVTHWMLLPKPPKGV